ncbi:transmembrane protein 233-like isoform X2 [Nycticebus coucang]|uniref:transmembrane protein 233-like isoform X2 n=1 Tax=Nycticebus coucang TaxID=9470 RepID=UPI00234D9AAF|nr:transmembrane protein 233-like isoform X2 [Nycticebus coucang]XP_053463527.1 transmembrane protein 233-like isoform X2 [Nycticebus coucang]
MTSRQFSRDPPVEDFLPLSIVSIFCCFPFGIIALVFSIKTRDANNYGDRVRAEKNSNMALAMGVTSIILGLLFIFFTSSFNFIR